VKATERAHRAEAAARKAREAADLAELVHGRSRPWERADFRRGDVVEVRKVRTARYVVVRANAKTITLRNRDTIDDVKCRYDHVLSRTRDGRTVTGPGQDDDAGQAAGPQSPKFSGLDEGTSGSGAAGGETSPSNLGGAGAWEGEASFVPGVELPRAVAPESHRDEEHQEAAHPRLAECERTAASPTAPADEHPEGEQAEGRACAVGTEKGWESPRLDRGAS
jgi:hypothetical protein